MKNNNKQYIYVLHSHDGNTQDVFYVGRSHSPYERLQQHYNSRSNGTEYKYEYIRELESHGISWGIEVVYEVPVGEYEGDHEREYVIKYVLQGCYLTNMKHGDAMNAEVSDQISRGIRTYSDIQRDKQERAECKAEKLREKIEAEEQARLRLELLAEEREAEGLRRVALRRLQEEAEELARIQQQREFEEALRVADAETKKRLEKRRLLEVELEVKREQWRKERECREEEERLERIERDRLLEIAKIEERKRYEEQQKYNEETERLFIEIQEKARMRRAQQKQQGEMK